MNKLSVITAIVKSVNGKTATKKTRTKKLSKKAEQVKEFVKKSDFGCKKDSVLQLMSIVLGEKLEYVDNMMIFKPGQVRKIVIDTDDAGSGHRWKVGQLVVAVNYSDADESHFSDGTEGNEDDFNYLYDEDHVAATPAEVTAFLKQLKKRTETQLTHLLKALI